MIGKQPRSFKMTPFEGAPAGAPHQEESIALVDLCEMNRNIALPFRQRIPTRGHGSLQDVQFPIPKHFIRTSLREFWEIYCGQSLVLEKTGRDRRDQWTVKDGVAVHHDPQLIFRHDFISPARAYLDGPWSQDKPRADLKNSTLAERRVSCERPWPRFSESRASVCAPCAAHHAISYGHGPEAHFHAPF